MDFVTQSNFAFSLFFLLKNITKVCERPVKLPNEHAIYSRHHPARAKAGPPVAVLEREQAGYGKRIWSLRMTSKQRKPGPRRCTPLQPPRRTILKSP